jgi:hypothetical protein
MGLASKVHCHPALDRRKVGFPGRETSSVTAVAAQLGLHRPHRVLVPPLKAQRVADPAGFQQGDLPSCPALRDMPKVEAATHAYLGDPVDPVCEKGLPALLGAWKQHGHQRDRLAERADRF